MPINNILIRGTNWIGDAVMTLPALTAVAKNFPDARLSVLTRPWAAAVYQGQAQVTEVLHHDKSGPHRGFWGRLKLAKELRSRRFDLAVLFQNAFDAALMASLARIPERWGYARDGRSLLLTKAIKLSPADHYIHESFYYLNILERAGLKAPFSLPQLKPTAESLKEADRVLKDLGVKKDDFLLALAPGAAFGSAKRWPAKNFAKTAELVLAEKPGRVLILGGFGEMEAASEVAGHLPFPALNLAGATSLATSLAILSRASLLVTNDSGLMHLGGALGVPLAAVFGPTNPLTTGPLGPSRIVRAPVACSPCLKRECPLPERICFDGVSPEKTAEAALSLINQAPKAGLKPAVFLDRDGTLNEEVNYLSRPEQMKLIPGAGRAVAALNRAGFKVVVATNQSGLARGYFNLETLGKIHARLNELLAEEGAHLDAIYFCPHHPEGREPNFAINCQCRKPEPGLFLKAAEELKIDLARSIWVGDRLRDIEAAGTFGGRGILVMTGAGLEEARRPLKFLPNLTAPDLKRAAEWILA